MTKAIGLLEFLSIAKGIESTDIALKASTVDLLLARPICPGKYIFLISGDVSNVRNSVDSAKRIGIETVVDELVIPNIHPDLIPAISAITVIEEINALGIIETFSCASTIEAADVAAKTAEVSLIEVRLGMGIGGKAFLTLTGEVEAVKSSIKSAAMIPERKGLLVRKVVIPSPHRDIKNFIL